jgi:hypothetical protein
MKLKLAAICFVISFTVYLQTSFSQEKDTTSSNFLKDNFNISGEIGTYGELYSISGQPARRPNSSGRIFFRPTLELFGLVQIPFDFLISTEGSSARQNINQFGISPSWKWGTLHLGDFSDDYSQYTLSGVNIRGGGIDLYPGIFRFATVAGFTQRSVPGGAQDGSYKRFLFAARLGLGKETGSFIDLIFLRAKDETGSLNQNNKSINIISPNGNDMLEVGSIQTIRWNSYGISGGIRIELSRDGGNTFEIIADNQPNLGYYSWTATGPITFQAIIKVTALEDVNIFDTSDLPFTIGSKVQSKIASNVDNIVNQNAVTPQENLILGAKGKIEFLNNKVSIEFDGAGSIYTRDIRSTELDLDSTNIPSFLTKIYKARTGTNYDFAFNTFLNLHLSEFNTRIGFKRIGPGYNSLGTGYLLNDIGEYSIINSFRISKVGINFGYIYQKDNLLDQKLFTTSRNIFNIGAAAMITEKWNASISANIMSMGNDAADSIKTDFASFVLNTNQSYLIDPQGTFRNINFNYSYQSTDNKSYNLKNNNTSVHTFNISASFSFLENLNSILNAGIISSSVFDTIKTTTQNFGLLVQHSTFENKLINTANINLAKSESNTSVRYTIGSGYQITVSDIVSVSISYMNFSGTTFRGGDFNELISSLNYSHRF